MSLVVAINGQYRPYTHKESSKIKGVQNSHKPESVKEREEQKGKSSRPYSHKVISSYEHQEKAHEKEHAFKRRFAREIMSSPVLWLRPHKNVYERICKRGWRQNKKARGIRHLPILENDILLGLVSNEDLLVAKDHQILSEIMQTEVVMAYDSTSLDLLSRILIENRIGAVPIINQNKKLVGIVSTIDILKVVQESFPFRVAI